MSVKNYLDLAEEYDTRNIVTEFEYTEYLDENLNEPNKAGVRTFNTRDEDVFMLPHKAVLEVHGQLLTAIGGDIPAGAEIALVNNGWSLFKSARYQLANQTVEDISIHLPIGSTILNIVSFSDDYSKSVAINMMWFKDTGFETTVGGELKTGTLADADAANRLILTPGGTNEVAQHNVATLTADAAGGTIVAAAIRSAFGNARRSYYNEGYARQKAFAAESRQITMMLPLSTIFWILP